MSDDIDTGKIDEAVLALLWYNLRGTGMAWKSFDWDAMERLHQRGLITNPVGKARSVELRQKDGTKPKLFLRGCSPAAKAPSIVDAFGCERPGIACLSGSTGAEPVRLDCVSRCPTKGTCQGPIAAMEHWKVGRIGRRGRTARLPGVPPFQ